MIIFRRLVDLVLFLSVPAVILVTAAGRPVLGSLFLVLALAGFCVRAVFLPGEGVTKPAAVVGLLAVILCLSLLPRLSNLSDSSMNSDELLWMHRGSRLIGMLERGRAAEATDHLSHPGIVPAYLIGCSREAFMQPDPSSGEGLDPVSASRLPMALVGAFTCVLLFLVGRLIWGDLPAFLAALFLSLDPVHVGLSRVSHVDATLACFFLLTALAYVVGELRVSWKWKLVAGVFFGFTILTKSPGFVLPAILLTWKLLARAGAVVSRRVRRDEAIEAPACRPLFAPVDLLALVVGYLVYVALFPKLWVLPEASAWFEGTAEGIPYRVVHSVCVFVRRARLAEIGAGVFGLCFLVRLRRRAAGSPPWGTGWGYAGLAVGLLLLLRYLPNALENTTLLLTRVAGLGLDMADPDRTPVRGGYETSLAFYPLVLLVRTPELLMVSCLVGGLFAVRRIVRDPGRSDSVLLVLTMIVGVVVTMSFARKMAMRYILSIQPFLCLLGGLAVGWACTLVRAGLCRRGRQPGGWPGLVAAALVISAYVPAHTLYFPNYYLYHNAFIGGAKGAVDSFIVGWGEGYREVTQALKSYVKPGANNVTVLGQDSLVRYYWARGKPAPTVHANIGTTTFGEADYLVAVRNELQRRRRGGQYRYTVENDPLHVVNLQGVDIAWIYRHRRDLVNGEKTFKASSRQMDSETGRRLRDDILGRKVFVAERGQDDPGWLMRGPRRTYGPGSYTASFRVCTVGAGTNRLGCLDVAVSDGGARLAERVLTRADFPSPDEYVDLSVPFELDSVASLEFRLYWDGNANMRVYGVVVTPDTPEG